MRVCNKIEDVLFEVRTGAADAVDLVLTNHLRQRDAEFSRAHRASDGDQHLVASLEQLHVRFAGINHRRGVEMPVVVLDECGNAAVIAGFFGWHFIFSCSVCLRTHP